MLAKTFEVHDVFRASYNNSDPLNPVHVLSDSITIDLVAHDFRNLADDEFNVADENFLLKDRYEIMDMAIAPLMRFNLIQQADNQYHLIWTWLHILMDGRPLVELLQDVFNQYDDNLDSSFKSQSSYRDYIQWINGCDVSGHKAFWQNYLEGFTSKTILPSKRQTNQDDLYRYGEAQSKLTAEETRQLLTFSRENKVTMNTLCQAAWAILLSRHNESQDVLFATTKTTRSAAKIAGASNCVGHCLATLPLRVKLDNEMDVSALLSNIRNDWVAIRPHEQSSLTDIAQWTSLNERGSILDSLCIFEGYQFEEELRNTNEKWQDRTVSLRESTNFKLAFMGYAGEKLKLKINFDNLEYDQCFAERLLGQLAQVFKSFTAGVEKIKDIDLLTVEESKLLASWNETDSFYDNQHLIHDLIMQHGTNRPEAVSVLCGDTTLSYRELDEQSTKLAGYLQSIGKGNGDRVGINMDRSTSMVVALLAVLKTGASYVPLDPAFPEDRLQFMAADSNISIVLRSNDDPHLFNQDMIKAIM